MTAQGGKRNRALGQFRLSTAAELLAFPDGRLPLYDMKRVAAEPYRNIDFSTAKRGPVIPSEPGKTKISIRIDNAVLDHFRAQVERVGARNYQTLMNDALVAYIEQRSVIDAVPEVVREELSAPKARPRSAKSKSVTA